MESGAEIEGTVCASGLRFRIASPMIVTARSPTIPTNGHRPKTAARLLMTTLPFRKLDPEIRCRWDSESLQEADHGEQVWESLPIRECPAILLGPIGLGDRQQA